MSAIAVVAGRRDAQFAEQVRAGLQAAGREATLQERLPADSSARVVLIWSAGLESAHAIDAKTLIGLWSEDRLTVVRRDGTPPPLGLRDLPSLRPQASAQDVVRAALGGAEPQEPAYRDPAIARVATSPSKLRFPFAGAVLVLAAVGGGAYYYLTAEPRARQAAALIALEEASKATGALNEARQAEVEAQKRLAEARAAELEAIKRGDTAKVKELEEARKKAEIEAAKQSELVKQREAAQKQAIELTKQAQEAAKPAAAAKAMEPVKSAETAPAPTAAVPSMVASAPSPKAPSPTKSAQRRANVPCEELKSRSEREACLDDRAANERLANAGRPARTRTTESSGGATAKQETQVAAAAPSAAAASSAPTDHEALYQQALAMENGGDAKGAIRIYRRAARAGSGKAAKRLGEIFDRGVPGVSRDYAESLQWYETARQLGERVETAGDGRGPSAVARSIKPEPPPAAKSEHAAAPVMPEAAKAEAPAATREPTPRPAGDSTAVSRAPAPAAAPPSTTAQSPAPAPPPEVAIPGQTREKRPFNWRFLLVGALVLGAIFWRRARRRRARQAAVEAQSAVAPALAAAASAQAPADGATLFVSYSHKDRSRVDPIVSVMEEMGRRVWMDRTGITGQAGWAGQIVRAIRECRAVVLMASPNSYGSDQVVRELYLAMNHKKAIVPIEIEPAEMPDELQYILAPYQHHRLSGGEARAVLGRALAAI